MSPRTSHSLYHIYLLNNIISARFFFFICIISFFISIIYIQLPYKEDEIVNEAIENVEQNIDYIEVYRKPSKLSKNIKYILLWTSASYSPFYFLGSGQRAFIKNNCSMINCYVTSDKTFFGDDLTKFDAIAFNGRNLRDLTKSRLPKKRSTNQKYLFVNLESSDNYPVCPSYYEGFFNWTVTYRLDSNVPYPYVLIKDLMGRVLGPKSDMKWVENEGNYNVGSLKSKKKAIAWFVSNCYDRSNRMNFVEMLTKALAPYKLTIDIYGKCGWLTCPIESKEDCDEMLEKDYYFYLAMENSFAKDYITEKVLTALKYNIVPIVYGGAEYSRFLPPGSYINARSQDVNTLAGTVAKLIDSPDLYSQFFRWKSQYSFHDPTARENVCSICAALNNSTMMEQVTVYENFREWWNPDFKSRCWWV